MLPSGDQAGSPSPPSVIGIHSASRTAAGRKGATKIRTSTLEALAANAIQRPSGEKRAPNKPIFGCVRTFLRSPEEIASDSTSLTPAEGRKSRRCAPSGDQSQIPKHPGRVAGVVFWLKL